MGKRKFAATVTSSEHKTASEKFANSLAAWIRGWEYGVEILAYEQDGEDVFEIWQMGGSNAKSNGRRKLGTLTSQGFIRPN